jgi:hypothetical protein
VRATPNNCLDDGKNKTFQSDISFHIHQWRRRQHGIDRFAKPMHHGISGGDGTAAAIEGAERRLHHSAPLRLLATDVEEEC